jgi:hypothetical protein
MTLHKARPVVVVSFVQPVAECAVILSGHGRSGRTMEMTIDGLCNGTTSHCETPWL